jgi:hypothetical protein
MQGFDRSVIERIALLRSLQANDRDLAVLLDVKRSSF